MKWINAKEKLPPVNKQDNWDFRQEISIRVLTYSSEWGLVFGRYYHGEYKRWEIEGIHSAYGAEVDHWMKIELPKTSDNGTQN